MIYGTRKNADNVVCMDRLRLGERKKGDDYLFELSGVFLFEDGESWRQQQQQLMYVGEAAAITALMARKIASTTTVHTRCFCCKCRQMPRPERHTHQQLMNNVAEISLLEFVRHIKREATKKRRERQRRVQLVVVV